MRSDAPCVSTNPPPSPHTPLQIADLFPRCKHATSIDLSNNGLTDAGAAALAAALAGGGAPDLISLDLRGTRVSASGVAALAAAGRKGLAIVSGPLEGDDGGEGEEGGEEDAPAASPSEASALAVGLPLPDPPPPCLAERCLTDARRALTAKPPRLAAAAASLWTLDAALAAEEVLSARDAATARRSFPPPRGRRLAALPPAARSTVEKAPATLARALDAAPWRLEGVGKGSEETVVSPGAPPLPPLPPPTLACGLPLPAVGSHRVAAASVTARLLALGCPDADARLAAARVLPRAVALALDHGHCSPLQARILTGLKAALTSPCERLWGPLLETGGGVPAGAGAAGPVVAEPPPPLPARLAAVLKGAPATPPGLRPPGVAFAAAVAALLAAVATGEAASPASPALAAALATCPAWTSGGGATASAALATEQEGELCGPRPDRGAPPPTDGDAEAAALGVGRALDGRELLQLLRSVRL